MQEGQNARAQVVERIRQSTSILVAVGNNPSVDALAASLGLSLMLNKMNKHATAVFSGQTPPAIQFLEPNKTFENNVDALRDFIISLDKEKADRLRYKVEADVVRIFITPYKTSITEKDLQYSQGDFNVELIIALGVEKREDLDKAIMAHGRILHDATVITVNADNQKSSLGSIDWNDATASGLCEMLVGLSEAFQQPGLLDTQMSTALLTGIVAATDRFSNPRTSPRVMTMAAQLMAAGANQQLIATNLQKSQAPSSQGASAVAKQQPSAAPTPIQEEPAKKKEPGELDITHEKQEPPKTAAPIAEPAPALPPFPETPAVTPEAQQEKELDAALPGPQVQHNLLGDLQKDLEAATEAQKEESPSVPEPAAPGSHSVNENSEKGAETHDEDYISSHGSWKGRRLEPPTLGGTLNATTEEAMEANKKAEDADRNKKLLNHPDDAAPPSAGGGRSRRGRNKDKRGQQQVPAALAPPTPVLPEPKPAPEPPPAPAQAEPVEPPQPIPPAAAAVAPILPPEPAQQPLPPAPAPIVPEPVAVPELPPQPAPEPVSAPPAPVPSAPPVLPELPPAPVVAPPLPIPPAPKPEPTPEPPTPPPMPSAPQAPPEPDLNALEKEVAASAAEAAAAAQPAQSTAGDLDTARQAVTDAFNSQPFDPAGHPLESSGASPVPAMPDIPVTEPSQNEVPAGPVAPEPAPITPPAVGDLPPLPPMPPMPPTDTTLPPAPNLPGLNEPLPPITPEPLTPPQPTEQPPSAPPAPADPGQFKIPGAP